MSILMISSSFDKTCDYIAQRYGSEYNLLRLNVDKFYEYRICVNSNSVRIESFDYSTTLDDINSIYYRKPSLPDHSKVFAKDYHEFANKEIFSFIEGIIESFEGYCLSKPSKLRVANNKIVQMRVARDIGFNMPESSITNTSSFAFFKRDRKSIVKPISIGTVYLEGKKEYVQTNVVDHIYELDSLKFCPAYFQEFINKDYELRITFVGDHYFPIRIDSEDKVDWRRMGNCVNFTEVEIPNDLAIKCRQMLAVFDLRFGCFDILVKDQKYYFLELNANGQWGWLETEVGVNISQRIIDELA